MAETDGMTITRVFAAPRELVFDAWTNPAHFAHWWGGTSVEVPADSVELDVRAGGSWRATMVLPEGGHKIRWNGEYLEVDPPKRLVLALSDGSGDGGGARNREGYQSFFDAMEEIFGSAH